MLIVGGGDLADAHTGLWGPTRFPQSFSTWEAGLGRYKLGSVMTVALSVALLAVRIFLARSYYAHGVSLHPGASLTQQEIPAAPASAWVVYATTDRDTQIRTQHARLGSEVLAKDADDRPQEAGPAGSLELRRTAGAAAEAILTLDSVPQDKCPDIDRIGASFDEGKAAIFDAEASWAVSACIVKIKAFDLFLQGLQNAQTLVVTPRAGAAALPAVGFRVAGLTWDAE